jgi:2-amino-4-hydroxy-6-hydroxymethyldihydropteridine diphosphokinase
MKGVEGARQPVTSGTERVFLGLGSNLGEREENLFAALNRIRGLQGTTLVRVSSFRETPPWGVEDQPSFLNAVAEIRTALEPEGLLTAVKGIEADLGRTPTYRWGPRLIDIDLLVFGERQLRSERLTLPHPHILERSFVWEPLAEIAPEIVEGLRRAALSL